MSEEAISHESALANTLGRVGKVSAWLTALLLLAVFAANALILALRVTPGPPLVLLVDLGPAICVLLANLGTGLGYYGSWRVLRGLDEYDTRDDAKNALLSLTQMLRNPFGSAGCLPLLGALLLVVSLIVAVLTYANPFHPLGFQLGYAHQNGPAVVIALPTATPTSLIQTLTPAPAGATPTATLATTPTLATTLATTPTPTRKSTGSVVVRLSAISQTCSSFYRALPSITIVLDNSASTTAQSWQFASPPPIPGLSQPWVTASATSGRASAGSKQTIALTPYARLCYFNPLPQHTYRVVLLLAGRQSFTVSDTVISPPLQTPTPTAKPTPKHTPTPMPTAIPIPTRPPTTTPTVTPTTTPTVTPVVNLTADPKVHTQSCPGSGTSADSDGLPYKITLDNSGSTVAVTWTFTAGNLPGTPTPWARAQPKETGTITAGATETFMLVPNPGVCHSASTTMIYTATLQLMSGGQSISPITLTDTIDVDK